MKRKREYDPELESLLQAFREVNPTSVEKDHWRAAITRELNEMNAPKPSSIPGSNVYRFVIRSVIQIGVAASLGFVIGAYFVERRYDQGQTMLFSQTEPAALTAPPPTTMDEEREVVRINLDSGDVR